MRGGIEKSAVPPALRSKLLQTQHVVLGYHMSPLGAEKYLVANSQLEASSCF